MTNARLVGIRERILPDSNNDLVVIVGCGGIGTWLSIIGVLSGWSNILLVDGDVVEESNLNRLPFITRDIGFHKVDVLQRYLRQLRPYAYVRYSTSWFAETVFVHGGMLESASVVFCCTDTIRSQKEVYDWCAARDIKYIRGGYDEFHVTITQDDPASVWESDIQGVGYTSSWAGTAMFAAALLATGNPFTGFLPGMERAADNGQVS